MGVCSGISTKWLFIHCFQTELEFRSVYFHVIISDVPTANSDIMSLYRYVTSVNHRYVTRPVTPGVR